MTPEQLPGKFLNQTAGTATVLLCHLPKRILNGTTVQELLCWWYSSTTVLAPPHQPVITNTLWPKTMTLLCLWPCTIFGTGIKIFFVMSYIVAELSLTTLLTSSILSWTGDGIVDLFVVEGSKAHPKCWCPKGRGMRFFHSFVVKLYCWFAVLALVPPKTIILSMYRSTHGWFPGKMGGAIPADQVLSKKLYFSGFVLSRM